MSGDHILCCICGQSIPRNKWSKAQAWIDPAGIACVAHNKCLVNVGEKALELR